MIFHHVPWDQVYRAQSLTAVERNANPHCATPSLEENQQLFLEEVLTCNAVKASVHRDTG